MLCSSKRRCCCCSPIGCSHVRLAFAWRCCHTPHSTAADPARLLPLLAAAGTFFTAIPSDVLPQVLMQNCPPPTLHPAGSRPPERARQFEFEQTSDPFSFAVTRPPTSSATPGRATFNTTGLRLVFKVRRIFLRNVASCFASAHHLGVACPGSACLPSQVGGVQPQTSAHPALPALKDQHLETSSHLSSSPFVDLAQLVLSDLAQLLSPDGLPLAVCRTSTWRSPPTSPAPPMCTAPASAPLKRHA